MAVTIRKSQKLVHLIYFAKRGAIREDKISRAIIITYWKQYRHYTPY